MSALGSWRWYLGVEEDDDEMGDYGTRDCAIRAGCRGAKPGDSFWIVEARMLIADEEAMAADDIEAARFAECRGGTWITVGDDGQAVEGE